MNVATYLRRINYPGSTEPTAETLGELHRAHMLAVPFENLDIHLGREIVLDDERLYAKIVEQQRGGFCYELNGAFAALLRELGFNVKKLAAGVARASGGFGPLFETARQRFAEELSIEVEPVRSPLGVPGEHDAGLLGYLRSVAVNH